MASETVREQSRHLADKYCCDLQRDLFPNEMAQYIEFSRIRGCKSPADMAALLHDEDLHDTFPNVSVALRMYMCLMVTNCSGERSFSKMSLIKNKLRNKMTDARLSALEMLSLESDLLSEVSFETIIEQFATVKSRKKL